MNFGEFPAPVCAPLKPRHRPVDYPGTGNIICGHRMREPNSNCRYMRQFYERRKSEYVDPEAEEEARKLQRFVQAQAFFTRTDKKIINRKIRERVEEGMAAYDRSVEEQRREELRGKARAKEEEEAALAKQRAEQARRDADAKLEEARARTERLKKEQEDQRLAVVAAKRMQQYLARCPDARQQFAKRVAADAKRCNLRQIEEKEARRRSERELDRLWHELMLKEVETKKSREVEEAKRRAAADKDVAVCLDEQVAGRRALEEEERRVAVEQQEHLELLWEKIREEERLNLERERARRAQLRSDLETQLLEAKRCLAERAREEAAMDRMFAELGEAELRREREAIRESSAALRGEMLSYLRHLEDLRAEEARRNAEVEGIVERSREDAEARRRLAVAKAKEARARDLRRTLEGRERQLREKREAEERERRLALEESEKLTETLRLEERLDAERREERRRSALSYGRELKEQQEYAEAMRRREAEEERRAYRDGLEREEEYRKLTKELIDAPEIITPHAFKILLKECAARRDAEQRGNCYCPPPLPREYR